MKMNRKEALKKMTVATAGILARPEIGSAVNSPLVPLPLLPISTRQHLKTSL